jgi:hypothetical protein
LATVLSGSETWLIGTSRAQSRIVDLYHARQHLWDLAALLYPTRRGGEEAMDGAHEDLLDHGRTELPAEWLREIAAEHTGTQPGLASSGYASGNPAWVDVLGPNNEEINSTAVPRRWPTRSD